MSYRCWAPPTVHDYVNKRSLPNVIDRARSFLSMRREDLNGALFNNENLVSQM